MNLEQLKVHLGLQQSCLYKREYVSPINGNRYDKKNIYIIPYFGTIDDLTKILNSVNTLCSITIIGEIPSNNLQRKAYLHIKEDIRTDNLVQQFDTDIDSFCAIYHILKNNLCTKKEMKSRLIALKDVYMRQQCVVGGVKILNVYYIGGILLAQYCFNGFENRPFVSKFDAFKDYATNLNKRSVLFNRDFIEEDYSVLADKIIAYV